MQEAEAVYTAMLTATQGEDYSDIEHNKFLQTPCKDLSGRAVVLVVARYLPADVQDAERLYRYTCRQLDTVADDKYCVVYVHTEASYWENSPGILFLRQAYERYVENVLAGCPGPDMCSCCLRSTSAAHPSLHHCTVADGALDAQYCHPTATPCVGLCRSVHCHTRRGSVQVASQVQAELGTVLHSALRPVTLADDVGRVPPHVARILGEIEEFESP